MSTQLPRLVFPSGYRVHPSHGSSGGGSVALLPGHTPALAKADPDTMARLIADVAQANQRLQDLNAQIPDRGRKRQQGGG